MKLIIREAVYADLEKIYHWIAHENPNAARTVVERILDAIDNKIALFPFMGRVGKVEDTREWVVRELPYIIAYRVDTEREAVTILAVFHTAQNR